MRIFLKKMAKRAIELYRCRSSVGGISSAWIRLVLSALVPSR
jgi:hypothetical protein